MDDKLITRRAFGERRPPPRLIVQSSLQYMSVATYVSCPVNVDCDMESPYFYNWLFFTLNWIYDWAGMICFSSYSILS